MNPRQAREERKAFLLREIQQQRLDLIATRRDWLDATEVYDRGWSKLVSLRSWAIVASSAMAVVSLRHPRFLVRWARRGLGIWSTWRMAKNLLR
ncbi:YqjK-like family protein [Kluyvera intermedia]|uniref:YqjK-like family protein n=1 Tax=Kluyvera intermedia TaxID=61648 RepID=UPI001F2C9718|nr:YqjK-like family protein [Kluyvera intermedia]EKU4734675.1 YqjK-like family protein [Kluyvera ascorbata]MCE9891042.1 YqjK-like family protein [Kluyvera intermedia]